MGKGSGPGRCVKLENEFRAMAKSSDADFCIDETVALMRCTSSSSNDHGCSAAFLAMRECNRFGGKQLVAENKGYAVAKGKTGLFDASASNLLSSAPPVRSLQGMTEFGAG